MTFKSEFKKVLIVVLSSMLVAFLFILGIYGLYSVVHQAMLPMFMLAIFGYVSFKWFARIRRERHRNFKRGIESECAYAVLGVDADATSEDIRRAYRTLAGKHHPDNVPEDRKTAATALLLRVTRAYEMIGDEDARFLYDSIALRHEPNLPTMDEAYSEFLKWRREELDLYDNDCDFESEPEYPTDPGQTLDLNSRQELLPERPQNILSSPLRITQGNTKELAIHCRKPGMRRRL